MQLKMSLIAAAIAPFVLVGGLMLAPISGVASATPDSAELSAGPKVPPPPGTPTGCDAPGYLCSYIYQGGFQGSADICIEAATFVNNWQNHTVNGFNCSLHAGALVNTHTAGDVIWYEGFNGGGSEQCINFGSYYDYLSSYPYPNGDASLNNIGSSYQDATGHCAG